MGDNCEIQKKYRQKLQNVTSSLINSVENLLKKNNSKLDSNAAKVITEVTNQKELCNFDCVDKTLNIIENFDFEMSNEQEELSFMTEILGNSGSAVNFNNKESSYSPSRKKKSAITRGDKLLKISKKLAKKSLSKVKLGDSFESKTSSLNTKLSFMDIGTSSSAFSSIFKSQKNSIKSSSFFSSTLKDSNNGKSNVKVYTSSWKKESSPFVSIDDDDLITDIVSFDFFNENGNEIALKSKEKISDIEFNLISFNYKKPACKTWFSSENKWVSDGISQKIEKNKIICSTTHFSSFSVVEDKSIIIGSKNDKNSVQEAKAFNVENSGFVIFIMSILLTSLLTISCFTFFWRSKLSDKYFEKKTSAEIQLKDLTIDNKTEITLEMMNGQNEEVYNFYFILFIFIKFIQYC